MCGHGTRRQLSARASLARMARLLPSRSNKTASPSHVCSHRHHGASRSRLGPEVPTSRFFQFNSLGGILLGESFVLLLVGYLTKPIRT